MKKFFLLSLVNLSAFEWKLSYIYAWNEQNILIQQKYQQDMIKNKDMFILDMAVKDVNNCFYTYYNFVKNKNFSNKYLSLVPIYNKIANNYLKNKKEINEFVNAYCSLYRTVALMKLGMLDCLIIVLIRRNFTCVDFRITKKEKIDISYFIVNFIDVSVYFREMDKINSGTYGIFLDDINLTKSYMLFSLKLAAGIVNIYIYQNKLSLFLVALNVVLDISGIFALHRCRKKINLNKNKYIKITKKEYEDFQIIRDMPLFVVFKNESSCSDFDYINNNFYETKIEGPKKCGYVVNSFYDKIQIVNNL